MRLKIRQSDLADLMGYEQSYISALEVGIKGPPTPEFVEKLVATLQLSTDEERELRDAAAASDRKIVLGQHAPRAVYWLFKDLRNQADELHPEQIKMIQHALDMKGQLVPSHMEVMRRLPRRRREEAST